MLASKLIIEDYETLSKKWNKQRQEYYESTNKIDRMTNMRKFTEISFKGYFCEDMITSNFLYLRRKYEVELAILELKRHAIDKSRDKLWREMENLFKITKNNSKYKKISKIEKRRLERETCAICYEEHDIKQIVTTCCGHVFGKRCISKILVHNYDNYIDFKCPCCRNDKVDLTRYTL